MPNTPALVQAGVTGLFANTEVSAEQRELAFKILSSVGTALWIENESLLDAVTALSGSGPAYFFYLIEAMIDAGQNLGLSEEQARELSVATASGAAKLITKSDQSAKELRHAVTSKGGTTEAAINTMQQHDMKKIIKTAIKNAAKKAHQLSIS
jgi:pyrroline-5-carboxylate reductase